MNHVNRIGNYDISQVLTIQEGFFMNLCDGFGDSDIIQALASIEQAGSDFGDSVG